MTPADVFSTGAVTPMPRIGYKNRIINHDSITNQSRFNHHLPDCLLKIRYVFSRVGGTAGVASATTLSKRRIQCNGSYSKRLTLPPQALARLGIEPGDSVGGKYLPDCGEIRLGPAYDAFEIQIVRFGRCSGITMPAAVCFDRDLTADDVVVVSCVGDSLRLRL